MFVVVMFVPQQVQRQQTPTDSELGILVILLFKMLLADFSLQDLHIHVHYMYMCVRTCTCVCVSVCVCVCNCMYVCVCVVHP